MTPLQKIIESKAAFRRKLARRPIAEKLRMVEEMAERTRMIRRGRVSRDAASSAREN